MNKQFTYSKMIPFLTGIIFVGIIIFSFINLNSGSDYSSSYNILITAISAAAGIFGASIIWYMKKSQAENTYKLDMSVYKEKAKIELEQYEKILELKKKYNLTDDEVDQLKFQTDLDDMTRDSFQRMESNVNSAMNDANTPTEIQNY